MQGTENLWDYLSHIILTDGLIGMVTDVHLVPDQFIY